MAKAMKKIRVASNPQRKPAHKKRNAARKGIHSHMTKKTSKNPKKRRAHNPATHHRKRRHNPGNFLGNGKEIMISAVSGLASAVLTSQIPQLILGTNNTSWMGYGANIATAIAATLMANSFAGKTAGQAAMVGGAVIVLDRFLTEQVSAIGPYITLSGVGDATAARMGTIRDGYYTHPSLVDGNGNLIPAQPYTDAAVAAVLSQYPGIAAAPLTAMMQQNGKKTAGMGAVNPSALRRHTASGQLLSSRFQGRFNQSLN